MAGDGTVDQGSGRERCAVCGSGRKRPRWQVRDTLLGTPGRYNIVDCVECGTLRMSPRPPFSDRRQAFSDDYPLFDWALGRKPAAAAERIARFGPQMAQINSRQRRGRLLDVGCGDGYFMLGMQRRGWETRGIELHQQVAAYARDRLKLDVAAGAEHEVDWQGPYDCITLFGVIEDVDDPNACLERCYRNLAAGGLLVVQTHNIACLEARWFGPDWFNIEAPRHVWHLSPRTLERLLENNHFHQDDLLHYGAAFVTEKSIENRRERPYPSSTLDRLTRKAVVGPAARLMPRLKQGIMIESYCRKQS
ncbi:bifunctional 3-demethylubiquinone-9 3-methyltransferase/ 2-octaprenyl-6-hydroxy phenol methylase [bacterium BMS3Abin01]|nr:bifunctional 3-demethylubiquinone-9 3-methyltransferase/ 2-octaprenyl-6-hydroxy phenol methylase [bacterium BMS3Abin01]